MPIEVETILNKIECASIEYNNVWPLRGWVIMIR